MRYNLNHPLKEYAWEYHRGRWSKIKNPLSTRTRDTSDTTQHPHWRRILQDYTHMWIRLGPASVFSNYASVLVFVYSYTGDKKAPQYLIRVITMGNNEIVYAQDFPDLLELLVLLAPLVSTGILSDVYTQTQQT